MVHHGAGEQARWRGSAWVLVEKQLVDRKRHAALVVGDLPQVGLGWSRGGDLAQLSGRYSLHSWPWLEQVHGWSSNQGVVQK